MFYLILSRPCLSTWLINKDIFQGFLSWVWDLFAPPPHLAISIENFEENKQNNSVIPIMGHYIYLSGKPRWIKSRNKIIFLFLLSDGSGLIIYYALSYQRLNVIFSNFSNRICFHSITTKSTSMWHYSKSLFLSVILYWLIPNPYILYFN